MSSVTTIAQPHASTVVRPRLTSAAAYTVAALITALNAFLIAQTLLG